jgi:DNA-directed RNA polymerase specialized sigma24 family protein
MKIGAETIARLRRMAHGLVPRDEADDLVQDALVKICATLYLPAEDAIDGWMSTVLYRTHFENVRAAGRMKRAIGGPPRALDELQPGAVPWVAPPQLAAVELAEINRTLDLLPGNWRRAVELAADGNTLAEIMREMGCARDTVMIWLTNARRVLRDPDLLGTRISFRGKTTAAA